MNTGYRYLEFSHFAGQHGWSNSNVVLNDFRWRFQNFVCQQHPQKQFQTTIIHPSSYVTPLHFSKLLIFFPKRLFPWSRWRRSCDVGFSTEGKSVATVVVVAVIFALLRVVESPTFSTKKWTLLGILKAKSAWLKVWIYHLKCCSVVCSYICPQLLNPFRSTKTILNSQAMQP